MQEITPLSNGSIEVKLDPENGSVASIIEKRTGSLLVSGGKSSRLFRLVVPTKSRPARAIDSHSCGLRAHHLEADGSLLLDFGSLLFEGEDTGIEVKVRISNTPPERVGSSDFRFDELYFTIHISNRGKYRIDEVRFPWVAGVKQETFGKEGRIAVANGLYELEGFLPKDQWMTFERNHAKRYFEHPFPLMLPWADISDGKRGLGLISYLEKNRYGILGFEQIDPFEKDGVLSFAWSSFPYIEPGKSWDSECFGLSVHDGDWHSSADRFRSWVDSWWKAPKLPSGLTSSLGYANIQLASFVNEEVNRPSGLKEFFDTCSQVGIREICIWHRAGGHYMPNGSTAELLDEPQEFLDELSRQLTYAKTLGLRVSMIVNLRLTTKGSYSYELLTETEAVKNITGAPAYRESFSATTTSMSCSMLYHPTRPDGFAFCQRPDSPYSRRAEGVIEKLLDLGFTSVFLDQPLNFSPCQDKTHGHESCDLAPSDADAWVSTVSRQVKSRSDQGYLIGELPELFATENIDLWWYWEWKWSIPQMYRYAMPDPLQMWVVDDDPGQINKAFALGFLLNFVNRGFESDLRHRPEIHEHLRALSELKKRLFELFPTSRFADTRYVSAVSSSTDSLVTAFYLSGSRWYCICAETGGRGGEYSLQLVLPEELGKPESVSLTGEPVRVEQQPDGAISVSGTYEPYGVSIIHCS